MKYYILVYLFSEYASYSPAKTLSISKTVTKTPEVIKVYTSIANILRGYQNIQIRGYVKAALLISQRYVERHLSVLHKIWRHS